MVNLLRTLLCFLVSLIILLLSSCEEVVELDLESSKERLVIEGLIKWQKGTSGQEQKIVLNKVAPFYQGKVSAATGASVRIENSKGDTFVFEEGTDGIYVTSSFIPEIGEAYTLTVIYRDETYTATEILTAVPSIDKVTQSTNRGFSQNNPEVNVFFTDIENEVNFYRTNFFKVRRNSEGGLVSVMVKNYVVDDDFVDGNEIFVYYEEEEEDEESFLVGDEFQVVLYGISERFYNYLDILEDQDSEGGPFVIPPVNVKGNCINTTDNENYPYGYFALSEFDIRTYNFE